MSGPYQIIGPLAYQGKENCESVLCAREFLGRDEAGHLKFSDRCRGWHCSYCDRPCSYQGHGCDAANAILGESERATPYPRDPV